VLYRDLFWDLSGWAGFDNQPPDNDTGSAVYWGITKGVGWEFQRRCGTRAPGGTPRTAGNVRRLPRGLAPPSTFA
jgi:hypothetical protein